MSEPRLQAAITPIRRPGKDKGISATANGGGYELLYVFTSGAPPFEQNTSYSKFAAWALLEHDGNCGAAAKVRAEREKHYSHHLHRRDVSSIGQPQAGGHETPRSGAESLSGLRLRQWREEDMRAPRWVWENRILLGALNSFTGDGGIGKSTFASWLIARAMRGQLPGHFHGEPINVLVVGTNEYGVDDTWVPA